MAGLDWIPFDTRFPTGPHAIALGVALQDPRAWSYVAQLWAWAALNQADGRFEGPAASATIEAAAGWSGTPGALVEAMGLPHIGLLDLTERGFYIHNWHVHCGAHIQKREKDRARKRKQSGAKPPRKLRGTSTEDSRNSAQEKEKEKEKETAAAAAGPNVVPAPSRLPTREERQAARWPLACHLAAGAAEQWGHAVSLPKTDTDRQAVEAAVLQLGDGPALQVVLDDVADAIDRGGLDETPGSLGFSVKALARAMTRPPAPAARAPRENPKPGDPDFNDQDAWWDFDAFLARDGSTAGGGAHG